MVHIKALILLVCSEMSYFLVTVKPPFLQVPRAPALPGPPPPHYIIDFFKKQPHYGVHLAVTSPFLDGVQGKPVLH